MSGTPPVPAAPRSDDVAGVDYTEGNALALLTGGDALFPAMHAAIDGAQREIWLATYIFHHDPAALALADALAAAAQRGVRVRVVVDGFGSRAALAVLQRRWQASGVVMVVYRPVDRWYAPLQPGQWRRLHQKLCTVDDEVAFIGGINLVDDRIDVNHGPTEAPRLDFAVQARGPVVAAVTQAARAVWTRAALGHGWRAELVTLLRSAEPWQALRALLRRLRLVRPKAPSAAPAAHTPMRAAFVVRDNLRRRRGIEHALLDAFAHARERIDLVSPYFYPGRTLRRALRDAARRGVQVRVLLQGKVDYRVAAIAARALYDEMLGHGVRVFEYQPAFLHAKVARVDDDWCTVGSSNIDPLSLLLNLEANLVVCDAGFTADLGAAFERALLDAHEVTAPPARGAWAMLRRWVVASVAHWFLRMAGVTSRY